MLFEWNCETVNYQAFDRVKQPGTVLGRCISKGSVPATTTAGRCAHVSRNFMMLIFFFLFMLYLSLSWLLFNASGRS